MSWLRSLAIAVALVATLAAADPVTVAVALDEPLCRHLADQVGVPDAAYRPGVDVDGNPVVPADLDPAAAVPDLLPLVVPLTFDLGAFVDLPAAVAADMPLMRLTVDGEGTVRLDGQPLDDGAVDELAAACREHRPIP